jgi:hypothetical protein
MSKPCTCDEGESSNEMFGSHEHCEKCDCILGVGGDEENICCWCKETHT